MAYAATIERLLAVLNEKCPEDSGLFQERKRVEHGLLSVGSKLHVFDKYVPRFDELVEKLGGGKEVLERNMYKGIGAGFCLVLPPVGSSRTLIRLLHRIGRYTGVRIFDNPHIQLQVCSPGRLDTRRAGILAMTFYLASDTLRQYTLAQFETTVSYRNYNRGRRLVIYDAGSAGIFQRDFDWWQEWNGRSIRGELPFDQPARTDILVGPSSSVDIENINLIATLLVHAQFGEYRGYWQELGVSFEKEILRVLEEHMLQGLLEAPWVHPGELLDVGADIQFYAALQELMTYAHEDQARMKKRAQSRFWRDRDTMRPGILESICSILDAYRKALIARSSSSEGVVA